MGTQTQSELRCPRCGYDLRAAPEPRCAECGLTFPAEQWESGVLRDSVPSCLDGCDPWQPHQVLWASLCDLLRGIASPRRMLTTLALRGPAWSAWLMLVVGTGWVYVIVSIFVAVAINEHCGAGPYVAVKSALLYISPRLTFVSLFSGVPMLPLVLHSANLRLSPPPRVVMRRLGMYWLPVFASYSAAPIVLVALFVPDFHFNLFMPALGLGGIIVLPRSASCRDQAPRGFARRVVLWMFLWVAVVLLLGSSCQPRNLEPPFWVYF